MRTCFVIQPFDAGRFDKRFDDVFAPAIAEAGLSPYRVDRDPKVEIPIDSIEQGIRDAALCLADVTLDNPNVWYELGYAFASQRPVVMVCSDERSEGKFPFDIQHRNIIKYRTESTRDFSHLKSAITERLAALLTRKEALRQIEEHEQLATAAGLSQHELIVIANLAGESALPDSVTSANALKQDAERSGLTSIGFSLALRRLVSKRLVELREEHDRDGDVFTAAFITDGGWKWVESHEDLFVLKKVPKKGKFDDFVDDIPF